VTLAAPAIVLGLPEGYCGDEPMLLLLPAAPMLSANDPPDELLRPNSGSVAGSAGVLVVAGVAIVVLGGEAPGASWRTGTKLRLSLEGLSCCGDWFCATVRVLLRKSGLAVMVSSCCLFLRDGGSCAALLWLLLLF
jgi:hypothetical protein